MIYKFIKANHLYLVSSIILFFKIIVLDKGIVLNDEGWFLTLLNKIPNGQSASQFHKLFMNVFNGNILITRVSYLIWEVISYIIFTIGFYQLLKFFNFKVTKKDFFLIFALLIIGSSFFSIPVCNIPFYVTLNKTIIPLSLGLLFLAISNYLNDRLMFSQVLIITSGITIGFQPFIMITSITIYPLYLILIYFFFNRNWKHILLFILGIAISVCYYFIVIESLPNFYANEISIHFQKYSGSNYKQQHGLFPMIRWVFITLHFLFFECILPAISIIGSIYILNKLTKNQKIVFISFLFTGFILFFYFFILKGEHHFAAINCFYALLIFLLIQLIIKKAEVKLISLIIILILIPIALSIGSDVDFKTRATDYIGIFFPFIYFFSLKYIPKGKLIFGILIFAYTLNFSLSYYKENWGYFNYSEQIFKVEKIGIDQNLKLDKMNYENLKTLKIYLKKEDYVIFSDKRYWAYSYLLKLNPISFNFNLNTENVISKLNKSTFKKFYLLETVYAPFNQDFLKTITRTTKYKLVKSIDLDVHKLYEYQFLK